MTRLFPTFLALLLVAVSLGQTGPRFGQATRSPEVSADRRVTFRLHAPNAKAVFLAREDAPRVPMVLDDKGNWTVTTVPLEPDLYVYSFVVDGAPFADPANTFNKPVMTGGFESIVRVPSPTPVLWEASDVPHGTVHRETIASKLIGEARDLWVYTPPGYDAASRKNYPVLYLLHGVMDDATAWLAAGQMNVILDNLIAQGKARPMIVVMPLGYGFPNVADRMGEQFGGQSTQRKFMETMSAHLLDEIAPFVEKSYRASRDRQDRAIAGLSLGGAQSLYIGLNHPDKFAWVSSFGAALITMPSKFEESFPKLDSKANQQLRLLFIACGTDDFLKVPNKRLRDWLTTKEVKYREFEAPGAHTWRVWRKDFAELAPLLFQPATKL